jgi:membrane-bound lytic murein transglycosylase MltF
MSPVTNERPRLGLFLAVAGLTLACSKPDSTKPPRQPAAPGVETEQPAPATAAAPPADSTSPSPPVDLPGGASHFVKPLAERWTGDLDGMIERRRIRVLVTPTRTQYWVERGRQTGAEYELVRAFEDRLNQGYVRKKHLKISVIFVPTSRGDLIPALRDGRGDIAVGILTLTPERLAQVDYGGPFFRGVREVPVTGPQSPVISTIDDLSGKEIIVRKSSSYWTHLEALSRRFVAEGRPAIQLEAAPEDLTDDDIMEMVNAGLLGITVVDRYSARLWAQIFKDLKVHLDVAVNDEGEIGWLIRKNSPQLKADIDSFARSHGQGTTFGNSVRKKYTGSTRFVKNAASPQAAQRFRDMVDLFRKYGERYSLDYLLMIAQGYQESQLQQHRKSPVGAIGVMQIMPATGQSLKVGDIHQLEPNIHAGVKYIRFMIDQYFEREPMTELNRTLFAFAAYNAGPSRIQRLRAEAARRGLDPNVWINNVEVVAAEKIGAETVTYVSNIYKYYVAYTLTLQQMEARRQAAEQLTR